MDDRPFYELDDEELILAEATDAALADGRLPAARHPTSTQAGETAGVLLRSRLDSAALERCVERNGAPRRPTIFDHALFMNACACVLAPDGSDRFGLDGFLRLETTVLSAEERRGTVQPDAKRIVRPVDHLRRLNAAAPDHPEYEGLCAILTPQARAELSAHRTAESSFFALRRVTLALLPQQARSQEIADLFRDYAMAMRVWLTALSAHEALGGWPAILSKRLVDADDLLASLLSLLPGELV